MLEYYCVKCARPNTIVFEEWNIGPDWFRLPALLHTVVLGGKASAQFIILER